MLKASTDTPPASKCDPPVPEKCRFLWYTLVMSLDFVRSTIRSMEGYTPGEQPAVGERVIKLNTNENPFPPSPKVLEAIRGISADALRRYPNPTADQFRSAAAKL